MLVTLLGIVTDVKPEQPEKALPPMVVTLLGIVTDVKPEQPEKALPPMVVTLLGMVVLLQPAMRVLVLVTMIALQLSREPYVAFPDSTIIEVKPEQPEYLQAALYQSLVR